MIKKMIIPVIGLSLLTGCFTVPSGYVGVKVNLYGEGGLEQLPPRRYVDILPSYEFHRFPVHLQNVTWTQSTSEGSPVDESITFQTKEGLSVNADVGFSYQIDPSKVLTIFEKHRKGVDEITDVYLRNIVRDSFNKVASTMNVEAVYGSDKNKFLDRVEQMVQQQIGDEGFVVKQLTVIGTMRLPKTVVDALNRKIEATQRAEQRENELREAEAQAKRKVIEAKALADSDKIRQQAITDKMIELKKLEAQFAAIEKWDGKLPQIQGTPENSFINLK